MKERARQVLVVALATLGLLTVAAPAGAQTPDPTAVDAANDGFTSITSFVTGNVGPAFVALSVTILLFLMGVRWLYRAAKR